MKYLSLALLLLVNVNAFAAIKGAPFIPEEDQRFDVLENDSINQAAIARKYAKAVYDVSIQGGGSTAHSLGTILPAGAVISRIYAYVNTAFTKAGGGAGVASLALQCSGTRNLIDYQNISAVNKDYALDWSLGINSGQNSNWAGSATFVRASADNLFVQVESVPTACTVNAVVRGDSGFEPYSAGKLTTIIEYFTR